MKNTSRSKKNSGREYISYNTNRVIIFGTDGSKFKLRSVFDILTGKINKCNDPNVGLSLNKNETYVKCYMGDTGLLVSHSFNENELMDQQLYKQIMDGKLALNEGMLYENVIAQMITAMDKKLYFYTRYSEEKHRNDIEIDFLISNDSKVKYKINPIEVKSSKNYTTTSLGRFKEVFGKKIETQIIIHPKNFSVENDVIKIPPYMLWCMF